MPQEADNGAGYRSLKAYRYAFTIFTPSSPELERGAAPAAGRVARDPAAC
eukprot:COSAG04_NODE_17493_length_468_cov_0.653117_1_plen_49_part_10